MRFDVEHYTYQTFYSEEDEGYVATVLEFPSLSWIDGSRDQAMRGIVQLTEEVLADMDSEGETIPEPLGQRHYSGKLSLRLTPEQHRRVAMQAAQHNVSINRYIAAKV